MTQADGADLDRNLAAGVYYVAVSGHGNAYYHPFLAGSGLDGVTGAYSVAVTADPLPLDPDAGPTVIQFDPGTNGTTSPFVIRLTMSTPIDPNSAFPGDTVHLYSIATGSFGDGSDVELGIDQVNFSDASGELQVRPGAPLGVGFYEIVLAGNFDVNFDTIYDLNGLPLGSDAAHPDGQDESFTFQITGVEGNSGNVANDTPAGAIDLGDITGAGLVQKSGAIGDDANDPTPFNPSDVDLYHFSIAGPGTYAVTAEVFARRIGSSLDPGVSLFRLDPSDGQLHLVAGNDNTGNAIDSTNGLTLPLLGDSLVFAGLTAGDYYVAVSSRRNVPDADLGDLPGQNGIFDPNVSYSGTNGATTGPYVLNVLARPDNTPPTVVSVTPATDSVLATSPTQIVVRFSEDVDLQQLAFRAYEQQSEASIASVYIVGPDGTRYYPRLIGYDATTHQATFLLLDQLAGGTFTLHLDGSLGLTDLAGNPLADFTTSFTVDAPVVGNVIADADSNDGSPQNLGVLFPHDLQSGVTVVSNADPGRTETSDSYSFQVLQDQNYFFFLTGSAGVSLTLRDADGNVITTAARPDGSQFAVLHAGTYVVDMSGWNPATAGTIAYRLRIALGSAAENPPALTTGAAPAIRLRLAAAPDAPTSTTPPVVVVPPSSPGGSVTPISTPNDSPAGSGPNVSVPTAVAPFANLAAAPIGGISTSTDSSTVSQDRVVLPAGASRTAAAPASGDRGNAFVRHDEAASALARLVGDGQRWFGNMWTAALDRIFATFGDVTQPVFEIDIPFDTSIEDADPALRPNATTVLCGLFAGFGVVRSIDRDERRRAARRRTHTEAAS